MIDLSNCYFKMCKYIFWKSLFKHKSTYISNLNKAHKMATGSSIAMETVFADKFQTLIEFVCPEKTYDDDYQKLLTPKEINPVCSCSYLCI